MVKPSSKVLAVGAHPDDIEWGCGGLLSRCLSTGLVVTSGGSDGEENANRREEALKAASILGVEPITLGLSKTELIYELRPLIAAIEQSLDKVRPDLLITHAETDTHQDHRLVTEAVLSASRDYQGTILFYRSPSTRPDFVPNLFCELSAGAWDVKLRALAAFESQSGLSYFQRAAVESAFSFWPSLYRGNAKFAEPFFTYRQVVAPGE